MRQRWSDCCKNTYILGIFMEREPDLWYNITASLGSLLRGHEINAVFTQASEVYRDDFRNYGS